MQNKKMCILILLTATFFMIIAVFYIKQTQNKISKIEYIVDNSNLESNIAIMVQDPDTKEYLKSNTIPVGKYKINKEKTHCIGSGVISEYNNKIGTIKFETEAADECYLFFDEQAFVTILSNYKYQGTVVGDGVMYFHDSALENSAGDGSYRYAGINPDNYLCFDGDICDDDHKYRIIGIFGESIKVIKMTSVGNKQWSSNYYNTWAGSTMDTYLNGDWLTIFGHADLIEDYDWHVGGMGYTDLQGNNNVKYTYDVEIASNPVVTRKVGLMYVSDYGYAAENSHWVNPLYNYKPSKGHDWMLTSESYDWTISRITSPTNAAFIVTSYGDVSGGGINSAASSVRPVFYLKPSVEIKSGSGTSIDPWILG